MKINRVLIISVFAGMMVCVSCRKIDQTEELPISTKQSTVIEKFFTIPSSTNPIVKTISQSIYRQNEKNKFVESLVKKIGYPRWDKAVTSQTPSVIRTESGNADSSIIYVPFAIPDNISTAAVLVVGVSPSDTAYKLVYSQHYQQYGFDSTVTSVNARNIFSMFAEFDYQLFGHTRFLATDGRIFGKLQEDTLIVTKSGQTGERNQFSTESFYACFTYVYEPPPLKAFRSSNNYSTEVATVVTVCGWFDDGPPSGGGGGGGTGGGGDDGSGGGGGGSGDGGDSWADEPPCPVLPRFGNTTEVIVDSCMIGWVPILPDPTRNSLGYLFTKLDTLQNLLQISPYFLVGNPCNFLNQFYWIGNFQVPLIVNNRIDSINQAYVNSNGPNVYQNFLETPFYVRDLNSAYGTVINCDYFPIRITSLPTVNGVLWTPQQLFDFFRRNINQFINTGIADFQPYYDTYFLNDSTKWFSSNPLGSLLHLDMINDGTVVVSDYWSTVDSSRFIVSTLRSPLDGIHPVSGNRTWGIGPDHANPGGYIFYTSAVDRITNPFFDLFNDIGELTPITSGFEAADNLWRSLQDGMINFIQANNGSAARYVAVPEVTFRPPWFVMREFLRGNLTLQQLKEAIGCP